MPVHERILEPGLVAGHARPSGSAPALARVRSGSAFQANYAEYRTLAARNDLIVGALEALWSFSADDWPCHSVCPKDEHPPEGLPFGGAAFDPLGKSSPGEALKKFTPATTNA